MYKYDVLDRAIVNDRVEQFRDQVRRRLAGELSEDEFKPLRLRNGVYLQLHAYMLRVAIPYGLLSSHQLRQLAHIARNYDKGYGHFTTRQNIQFNWPALDDVPDILQLLADVEMHAIQTSGNCIRNVTADVLAGVAADEIEDPRPYCEIIRQWSTFHPEFLFLPRKFKIAVTGAAHDRAAVKLHDIGLRLVRNDVDEVGFEVLVGGGMGRTPMIGKVVREFLPKRDLLSYLEAILRIYNLEGRRDNLFKARIKILVHSLGIDAFRERVETEWEAIRKGSLQLDDSEIARLRAYFTPPRYVVLTANERALDEARAADAAFARWFRSNVVAHKVPGYSAVYVSLKAPGAPPGDASDSQMEAIADIADQYSFGQVRVAYDQNLVLADVANAELYELWGALDGIGCATANIGTLTDIICCPGLDYCGLATARSIPIAKRIGSRFDDIDYLHDLGKLTVNLSGCINSCAHHHTGNVGILGLDKNGEEYYQVTLGGSPKDDASIGKIVGPAFSKDEIVDAVETMLSVFIDNRHEDEPFLATYRRIGEEPFKKRLYAHH